MEEKNKFGFKCYFCGKENKGNDKCFLLINLEHMELVCKECQLGYYCQFLDLKEKDIKGYLDWSKDI